MLPYLRHAPSAASTNDEVAAWIRAGCEDGRALYVDEQSAGRGRRGRRWEAPPGENLTLSVALVGVRYQAVLLQIPLAAAVGASEAIRAVAGVDVAFKWPNDLYIGTAKLGGVLSEAVLDGAQLRGVVVGIGVNVLSDAATLSARAGVPVASLRSATGRSIDVAALAAAVRERIVAACHRLRDGDREGVLADWAARDATAGRRVNTDAGAGIALGIDGEGALRVLLDDGREHFVRSGEVTFAPGGAVAG